jgi:anti-sigma regulatory factor (Ser/Thr protein kinase)
MERRPDTRFAHPALFYRSEDDYQDKIVPFVTEGLALGHPVAVVVPAPRLRQVRDTLGDNARHVTMLDMFDEGRNPGRLIGRVLHPFLDDHPDQHVRVVGEPLWAGRTPVEYPACVQHEALINIAFAGRDATVLCPYDAAGLDDTAIADAHVTHPVVWGDDGAHASDVFDPDRALADYNVPLDEQRAPVFTVSTRLDITEARWFATERAAQLGVCGERLEDMAVIATELVTNSVMHTPGPGLLSVFAEHGHVVCEVRDPGVIADPLAGRRPVDPRDPQGCGLLLVNELADLVRTYTGDGTTVRALIRV